MTTNNQSKVTKGMLAGLMADLVSSLFILLMAAAAILPNFNIVIIQGSIFGLAENIAAAWMVYFAIGVFIWGIIYPAVQPFFPGETSAGKGIWFGVFIWLIIMIVVMPIAEAGVFANKYGIAAALFTLVLDLIFGLTLGVAYGKLNTPKASSATSGL